MLKHVSASQVDTFRRCQRLWAFQKLAGIRTPASPSQARGTMIHAALEAYLRDGTLPDDSLETDNGLRLRAIVNHVQGTLPAPGEGLLVEHPFNIPTFPGGPDFQGFMDLVNTRLLEAIDIWDHKTTSNFRYNKTPEELLENTQMMAYAYAAWNHLPEIPLRPVVRVGHHYISTNHKFGRSTQVWTDVPKEHAQEKWDGILSDVTAMAALADGEDARALAQIPNDTARADLAKDVLVAGMQGNPDACNAYGGCYFKDICPEANSFVSIGRLFQTTGGNMTTSMDELKARLAARMGAPAADPAPASPPTAEAKSDIVPPDSPPRVDGVGDAPQITAAEPEKPKRGRPKKAEPATAAPQAPTAAPAAPITVKANLTPASRPGRVIYINCTPITGPDAAQATAWTSWMRNVLDELHSKLKVLDYRLVEYGKGRGALTAYIKDQLNTLPDVCVVDTSHPEAGDFLALAMDRAETIVRGGR